jgi:hypothetical protein
MALFESSRCTKACSSGVVEEASVPSGDREKTTTNDITNDVDDKTLCKFSPHYHILVFSSTNSSRVASKEL